MTRGYRLGRAACGHELFAHCKQVANPKPRPICKSHCYQPNVSQSNGRGLERPFGRSLRRCPAEGALASHGNRSQFRPFGLIEHVSQSYARRRPKPWRSGTFTRCATFRPIRPLTPSNARSPPYAVRQLTRRGWLLHTTRDSIPTCRSSHAHRGIILKIYGQPPSGQPGKHVSITYTS